MFKPIQTITLVVLSLVFWRENATFECPVPAKSRAIYFDLEQISAIKLDQDFTTAIQSPLTCEKENDPICDKQLCCADEEGCCLYDPKNKTHKCGCRESRDRRCIYPAPLAFIGNSVCESYKQAHICTCLRRSRWHNKYNHIKANESSQEFTWKTRDDSQLIPDVFDDLANLTVQVLTPERRQLFLHQFTVAELADKLEETVIKNLAKNIAERKAKGESYGLPE